MAPFALLNFAQGKTDRHRSMVAVSSKIILPLHRKGDESLRKVTEKMLRYLKDKRGSTKLMSLGMMNTSNDDSMPLTRQGDTI